jgi:methylmalonyl-CoA/ethylmalonyl-CoA epimerase
MSVSGKEVVQVGIIVKDVEDAARKLEELIGIGPFEIIEPDYRDLTFQGKTGRFKMKLALAKAGSIQIELMQPLQGETIYDEFVKRKGYGLHHLGIKTDDMERSVNEMETKGGVKWAYLSTEPRVGLIFELLEKKTAKL